MGKRRTNGTDAVEAARERGLRLSALVALAVAASSSCQMGSAADSSATVSAAEPMPSHEIPEVLATVNGENITMEDVRERAGQTLDELDTHYQLERSKAVETALDQILRDRVLLAQAKQRGTTVEALIEDEAGGDLTPSDIEVSAWYSENRARVGGRTLDQVRAQIVQYLESEKRQQALEHLQERLNEEYGVQVFFRKFRLMFSDEEAPSFGPEDAPVVLEEFSDFQCPFCGRVFPVLQRVKANYPDKVRIVYRQFPLTNLHPNAFKAAEASMCAHAQGRFWEMHDLLFSEQDRLSVRDLKEKAGRLGLDQQDFDQCLDSGRYVEYIQRDFGEGKRVGVNGTPALFLNGVPVEGGAVTYDVLAGLIDDELAAQGR